MFEDSSSENVESGDFSSEVLERKRSEVTLEKLLENLGPVEEVDWGETQGQEIWQVPIL